MDNTDCQKNELFAPIFLGVSLSVLLFSISFMQVLITFGQFKNEFAAKTINLFICAAFILITAFIDFSFSRKATGICVFPIAFFLTSLVLCFASFLIVSQINFVNLYGESAFVAFTLFRTVSFQISIFVSVTLLIRIIVEFIIYINRTKQ